MNFRKTVFQIALPITVQSLVQASFSVIDQIMTGQLGSVSVAAIGLGGKFSSLFSVVVAAIATVAGIVFAQYIGSGDKNGVSRMFTINTAVISAISIVFQIFSMAIPFGIMSLYSKETATIAVAGGYLFIIAIGFLPQALSLLMSSLFRCQGNASFPLFASLAAAVINTALNYILIFGHMGMPRLGVDGAAIATTVARFAEFLILAIFMLRKIARSEFSLKFTRGQKSGEFKMFICILLPMLATEFLWSLGENVYAVIYGRMGTDECAAMTLTNPIQSLMIGAMTGLSAASGIIIGRLLGEGNEAEAYANSKKFIKYGFIGSIALSAVLLLSRSLYVEIFNVNENVKNLTCLILIAYAIIAPIKVENMILGGGIVRSGGKTKYIMAVDIIGTWGFGVPLGLISAFVLHLPIYAVYFILSLEECVRFAITLWIFKRKKWMNNLAA
ncbi:MAG: MATE family efflux transporter [Firmicutes bacterium]|nr:MATE family efflux transporter [Bacillota bacterium]